MVVGTVKEELPAGLKVAASILDYVIGVFN
jgi:hypothetical protein